MRRENENNFMIPVTGTDIKIPVGLMNHEYELKVDKKVYKSFISSIIIIHSALNCNKSSSLYILFGG